MCPLSGSTTSFDPGMQRCMSSRDRRIGLVVIAHGDQRRHVESTPKRSAYSTDASCRRSRTRRASPTSHGRDPRTCRRWPQDRSWGRGAAGRGTGSSPRPTPPSCSRRGVTILLEVLAVAVEPAFSSASMRERSSGDIAAIICLNTSFSCACCERCSPESGASGCPGTSSRTPAPTRRRRNARAC